MSNLSQNEVEAIHSLSDSELEKLHAQVTKQLLTIMQKSTLDMRGLGESPTVLELLNAGKTLTNMEEARERMNSIVLECLYEMNRRNYKKGREGE